MASCIPLRDMEENFFLCSVCLAQFKEPKQLPCLHRYCKDCLKSLIQSSQDETIKCPMCQEDYVIPTNGVDYFKTDFHMKSMIEFIELQKSLEEKELKTCIDCSNQTAVTAYCFKCKNFLCDPCYQRHLNNPMLIDHQAHILNLENIKVKNLTLERLALLTEDPMCHKHKKQSVQLCCVTCGNVSVCMACVYGEHKGHDLHDVTEIAKSERESLQVILDELNLYKSKLYEFPEKVKTEKRKLKNNLSKEKEKLRIQYEVQENEFKANMEVNNAEQERHVTYIKYRLNYEENKIASNREKDINLVRKKYDEIMTTVKEKYDKESTQVKKKHDEIEKQICLNLNILKGNLKSMTTAHELLAKQNDNELQTLFDHCKQIMNRYENFIATTSSILASQDEWTDVQCIPDIRAASKPLIEEMKKIFPELESLSDLHIGGVDFTILKLEEYVVVVKGMEDLRINGITSNGNGSIVITDDTYITVINIQGEIQRRDYMNEKQFVRRYCCFLSKFQVATCTFLNGEIGIYDIRDGSYKKIYLRDVNFLHSVSINPVNNNIIVGNSRYVYVYDDQLNNSHTITLPDVIERARDITVHGSNLLICGHERAYAVTMEGSESTLLYEFSKPELRDEWRPLSVCTDKNGFIFMLWSAYISDQRRCVLVQYSQDGRQLLAARPVDKDVGFITSLQADEAHKIMISTKTSGKLYTYTVYNKL